jgi:nucleoside 2-deoxyribosyltransferase
MEKRYQVFISSTYRDLHEERQEVIRALLELDCIPSGMELFPAADEDAWTLIRRVIDDSDYYLVISAGRYGSVHPDTGVGYTEMEYDYAIATGKPVLAFMHADPTSLPEKKIELNEKLRAKLERFRERMRLKVVKEWTDEKDLGAIVSRGITQAIKYHGGVGWVRADRPRREDELQISELRRRVAELERDSMNSGDPDFDKILLMKEGKKTIRVDVVGNKSTSFRARSENVREVDIIMKVCYVCKIEEQLDEVIRRAVEYFFDVDQGERIIIPEYQHQAIRSIIFDMVDLKFLQADIKTCVPRDEKPHVGKWLQLTSAATRWIEEKERVG